MGGDSSRALNAVTIAITGALGGQTDLQTASNALAPYAAQVIGEKFGHGEDKNTTAQMVSHAILGATLAYVNGGNPAAGGTAAVASEAAANYFVNQYKDDPRYQNEKGEFVPNLLPEDVKTQIRDLTAAIGAVAGGTVGDSAFNAQLAGVVGQNAVENNYLSLKDTKALLQELNNAETELDKKAVYEKYAVLSKEKSEEAKIACQNINSSACQQIMLDIQQGLDFIKDQDTVLKYKNDEMQALEINDSTVSNSKVLHLEISKFGPDLAEDYKNRTDVKFVENENLKDLAKYNNQSSNLRVKIQT